MSGDKVKVLVFGLGAIGGFYAFILSRNDNVEVSVVARSNYDEVKANGLKIESYFHGEHLVKLDHVYRSPSAAQCTFDYILCAHKALDIASAPSLFVDVANENTTFIIVQNGVGNEDPFRKEFPKCSIISCVTWVRATQHTSGTITHGPDEEMQMGLFPNPEIDAKVEKSRIDKFASFLQHGGTAFSVEENVQVHRWKKCIWNAVWNPVSTLTQVDSHSWLKSSPEATETTKQLWRDMIAVAQRCDVPLEFDMIDELIEKIWAMKPVYSSMYTDSQAGRPLEVDVILGTAMRKANEFGMDVPTLRTVYSLTTAIDQRIRRDKQS